MRIPIPTRVDPKLGTIFIVTLFLVELAEGTDVIFAGLVALWMALYFTAFTLCKGMTYPSGAWITFFGLASAFIGLIGKALLFEPAQTHLLQPIKIMSIYCVGMAAAGVGAWLGHRLAPRRALLEDFVEGETLHRASIGCLVTGLLLSFGLNSLQSPEAGSVLAILQQLNHFPQVAVILGTYYTVAKTNGRRSVNWVVLMAGASLLYLGLLTYSKEGLFFPFVAWFLSAVTAGAQFTRKMLVGLLLLTVFMVYYLVPYSQYGRKSRADEGNLAYRTFVVLSYLTDLEGTRKAYYELEDTAATQNESLPHYYDKEQTLLGREQMLAFDDSLVSYTDEGNVYGLTPELVSLLNVIPHFLWPNKPSFSSGNYYGRELGVIDSEDESTGISFSPIGDAYHQGKWLAVIFILPMVVFLYAFNADALVGGVKRSPWALLPIAISVSVAPEGLLAGTIYMATFTMVAVTFIAVVSRFVFPLVVGVVLGEVQKRTLGPRLDFTPSRQRRTLLDNTGAPEPGPESV